MGLTLFVLTVSGGLGVGVFLLTRWLSLRTLKSESYDMDPHGVTGSFEPHLKRYEDLAKLFITISAATIGFIASFLVNLDTSVSTNSYRRGLENASPFSLVCLCLSIISLLFFILKLNANYESYSHSEKKDTYTRKRYATQQALGFSGLFWFVTAFLFLAGGLLMS